MTTNKRAQISNVHSSEAGAVTQDSQATAQTPSAAIVSSAKNTATCKGPDGRVYTIRRFIPSRRMQLTGMLGDALSKNEVYFGNAFIAASIAEIDGKPEGFPTSVAQLMALMDRIGEDGLSAVAECYAENWGSEKQGDAETIKN